MSISSETHFCKGIEKGNWFRVIGYSFQNQQMVVEYLNDFCSPALMYKWKSDFQPIPTKGKDQ